MTTALADEQDPLKIITDATAAICLRICCISLVDFKGNLSNYWMCLCSRGVKHMKKQVWRSAQLEPPNGSVTGK